MKEYGTFIGICATIFCILMMLHMSADWHFNGMAGIFAVLALAIATITVAIGEP